MRLIIDMRKGNCYFVLPDGVELVTPTAISHICLDTDEIMVMSRASLANYSYRCRVAEEYFPYFGLPGLRVVGLGLGWVRAGYPSRRRRCGPSGR